MCLRIKNQPKPLIAEQDIECYKVLVLTETCEYITPYMHRRLSEQEVKGEEPFLAIGNKERENYGFEDSCEADINGGYIHTFATLKDAEDDRLLEREIIFKCIIPKGTAYYKGYCFQEKLPSFASEQIVFGELLKC